MPEGCPLVKLHRALCRELRGIDSATLLTELGVPANLQSLVDGLRRTRTCIERFPDELDVCLRVIPEERLDSVALIDAIDRVLKWGDEQTWPADDLRRLPMERSDATARHPLAGYCLSVLLHWSDLYYVLEPGQAAAPTSGELAESFDALMAEFSGYVIAAQAAIDPAEYLAFCRKWWGAERLPDVLLYPTRRLASRVAGASRAVRRLSRIEHRALLQFLLDPANGDAFHQRIYMSMQTPQFAPADEPELVLGLALGRAEPIHPIEADWSLLQQIGLLLEEVRPGWRRPNTVRRRGGTRRGAKRTHSQHRSFRDGYVRVPEQDVIRFDFETDDDLAIEHLQPLLPAEPNGEIGVGGAGDAAIVSLPRGGEEPKATQAAEREARAIRDGTRWIPFGEQQTDADIDVVEVTPEGHASASGRATPQWAKEHIRRYQLALGFGKERLSLAQVGELLKAIARATQSNPDMALLALHVSIALGRSIHDIAGLEVHAGRAESDVDGDRIHYFCESRQWVFTSPAPAWAAMPVAPIERPRLRQLWLQDHTDFHALVERYGLFRGAQAPPSCRPFGRLARNSCARLDAFLQDTLPSADVTPAKCAHFLFHRVLAVTSGDLGIANLITGRQHSHSGSVRHYANYAAPRVWRAYFDAWLDEDEQWISSVSASTSVGRRGEERRYGAKRVPEAGAVRALVMMLAQRTRDATLSAPVRHNYYTAYTLVGMVLGLGLRPVVEPLLTGIGGNADARLLVSFVDKARSDYDRRINPLPAALAQHLRRYTAYRNLLAATLPSDLARAKFVYLDPASGAAGTFHPGDFERFVAGAFQLELYSLRRFARTELASNYYVAAEDLDAYMGHWLFGVSPLDPLSTYPMQRLYDLAAGPLTRLLDDLDFVPVEPP